MDAIVLYTRKRGIRFFRKLQFPNTCINWTSRRESFLGQLKARKNEYDNVLIIAHGSEKAILTTTRLSSRKNYREYIREEEVGAFVNDFVFAVSCLTANEFGKKCVEAGCISYLGYLDQIEWLFSSFPGPSSGVPKTVSNALDTIIKHIFVEVLAVAYEEFLREPISVKVLRQRFSFMLEKRIAMLVDMTDDQIYETYGIKISSSYYKKYFVNMVLLVLGRLNGTLQRLICIGDDNYISASYIKYKKAEGQDEGSLKNDLINNSYYQSIENEDYKRYLLGLVQNL